MELNVIILLLVNLLAVVFLSWVRRARIAILRISPKPVLEEHKPRLEGIGLLENFSRLVIIVTGLIVIAIISVLIYPLPFQPPPYTLVIRNLRPAVLVALFFFIALFFQDLLSKRKKLVAPPKVNFPSDCMRVTHA